MYVKAGQSRQACLYVYDSQGRQCVHTRMHAYPVLSLELLRACVREMCVRACDLGTHRHAGASATRLTRPLVHT